MTATPSMIKMNKNVTTIFLMTRYTLSTFMVNACHDETLSVMLAHVSQNLTFDNSLGV